MLSALTQSEREIVRRAMHASLSCIATWEYQTRLGVTKEVVSRLLEAWPNVDDSEDGSHTCRAINNALNEILHGVRLTDEEVQSLMNANRAEIGRVYHKWAKGRGRKATGIQ